MWWSEQHAPPLNPAIHTYRSEEEPMTLSTIQPLANRRDVARTIFRYGPSTAALFYPLLLVSLHQSGRQFVQATDATGKLLAGLAVGLAAALVYSVPLLSFAAISQSTGQIRTRQFAHLAFAAPPLFVLIGVFFYMLNVPNGDYAFWAIAWLGVLGFAAFVSPTKEMSAAAARWLRTAHGLSAGAIIVMFLWWYPDNHVHATWILWQQQHVQ